MRWKNITGTNYKISAIGLAFPSSGGASHIKAVCEGRRKSLKGFTFRYKKEGETN